LRRCTLFSFAVLGLTLARSASAGERASDRTPIALTWNAPPVCPTGDDVLAAAAKMIRVRPAASIVHASAVVRRRAESSWSAELSAAGGSRHLEGASCDDLANTIAFILALAVDPNAVPLDETPPPPSGERMEDSHVETKSAAPPEQVLSPGHISETTGPSAPLSSSAPRVALAAGIGVAARTGTLPSYGVGPSLLGSVRIQRTEVELLGDVMPSQTATLSLPLSFLGARISAYDAGLGVAQLARFGRFEVGPRLGLSLSALHATGFGTPTATEKWVFWIDASLGARAGYALGDRWSIVASIDAELPLARPELVIEGAGSVHRPSPFAFATALGLAVRFL
jgi:hypothetical protein